MNKYAKFTREELISKLESLEAGPSSSTILKSSEPPSSPTSSRSHNLKATSNSKLKLKPPKAPKTPKPFHFSAHPTRHIALLLTYHGWPYSGLAIQSENNGAINTVEGELLKALEKTKLIEEGKGFEGCEYARCGRTDRGVSGEGQVVNLWVRSCRSGGVGWREAAEPVVPTPAAGEPDAEGTPEVVNGTQTATESTLSDTTTQPALDSTSNKPPKRPTQPKQPPSTEFPYPRLLNGVLPPSIRVIAWSPVSPDFNSRFSCSYRHYKYPFHLQFPSSPSKQLDLSLMRTAAESLIGEHDFRNFCKLDGSKQILNHSRRVIRAWFEENPNEEGLKGDGAVVFNLIGTAFLWHQVRHIIAALLLVGSKLEDVSLIKDLLDVEKNPSKPNYVMGDPLPLTLYECGYEESDNLDWRYGGYDGPWKDLAGEARETVREAALMGRDGLEADLVAVQQEAQLRTWQTGGALRTLRKTFPEQGGRATATTMYPVGGGQVILTGKYKPVAERQRGETPDEVNRKWREMKERKGAEAGRVAAGEVDDS